MPGSGMKDQEHNQVGLQFHPDGGEVLDGGEALDGHGEVPGVDGQQLLHPARLLPPLGIPP